MATHSQPTLFDRVADIVRSYLTAEKLARELAEQQLDSLGLHRITVKLPDEAEDFKDRLTQAANNLPDAVNACSTLHSRGGVIHHASPTFPMTLAESLEAAQVSPERVEALTDFVAAQLPGMRGAQDV